MESLAGVRVLVVEHYPALRWLQAHILRRKGAEVLEAGSGAEALGMLDAERVDVVLLDCDLYDMPAPELRSRMREMPAVADVPVIYIAGSEADPPPPDGQAYLPKPIDTDKLVLTIRLVLGHAVALFGF
jgi:CheY-like chemotaxis protein